MNTTELIELLKSVEFGTSGKPREVSISFNSEEMFFPNPKLNIAGTGDGVAGAELTLELTGEVWLEVAIEAAEFYGKGKEERLISYMKDFVSDLNQLEEPETTELDALNRLAESVQFSAGEIASHLEKLSAYNGQVTYGELDEPEQPKITLQDLTDKLWELPLNNRKLWLARLNDEFQEGYIVPLGLKTTDGEEQYLTYNGSYFASRRNRCLQQTFATLEEIPEFYRDLAEGVL